jgi:putative thiamine transport system permease protein
VASGLGALLLAALGLWAPLGAPDPAAAIWRDLAGAPGLWPAAQASLVTGLGGTLLALGATLLLLAGAGERGRRWLGRVAAPLVAVPPLAVAVGLAFLLAPSGWIARLLSPWLTGWERPPDLLFPHDPAGLALILGLAVKETPFLLLVALAALAEGELPRRLAVARSLGQGPAAAWLKVALPALYPRLRWPLLAVLAYGLGAYEPALVLGPTQPPTLAVLLLQWSQDPSLALWPRAAAGSLLQILLVALALLAWRGAEAVLGRLGRAWAAGGGRPRLAWTRPARGLADGLLLLGGGALLVLPLWSLAGTWRFPAALPQAWSGELWTRQAPLVAATLGRTALLALATTALALLLTLLALAREAATGRQAGRGATLLLYLPLLAPPVALALGWGAALAGAGAVGGWLALVWSHLLYVLPYVFIALAGPWRRVDPRHAQTARALGLGRLAVFRRVRLPLARAPVLTAGAIGIAVSAALYLPTLVAGGGRFPTLATEAVALSSGGDRRLLAALALLQALLPLAALLLALRLGRPRFASGRRAARVAP